MYSVGKYQELSSWCFGEISFPNVGGFQRGKLGAVM